MKRYGIKPLAIAILTAAGVASAGPAFAQLDPAASLYYGSLYDRPTVSPYLNLVNPGAAANAIPNYFTLVRPQLEQRAAINETRSDVNRLRRRVALDERAGGAGREQVRPTGHQTRYMYYGPYYQFDRPQMRR